MRPMMGYYFNGPGARWPGVIGETDAWTDLDVLMWRQFDYGDTPLGDLRRAVKRSVKRGRGISLDLDIGYARDTWKRQVKMASKRFLTMPLTDPWASVKLIDVADELPPMTTTYLVKEVRAHLQSLGLAAPPIGATFGYKETRKVSDVLDYVGLEAYLDVANQVDTKTISEKIRTQLKIQAARITNPSRHQVVVVLQAYARNGTWTNMMSLRELQRRSADAALDLFGAQLLAIKMFSWMRPSGTHELPEGIRMEHKALWTKLHA